MVTCIAVIYGIHIESPKFENFFLEKRSDQLLQFLFEKRFHTFNLEIDYAIYQHYMPVYFCFRTVLIDGKEIYIM